jgi:hypothetical protein
VPALLVIAALAMAVVLPTARAQTAPTTAPHAPTPAGRLAVLLPTVIVENGVRRAPSATEPDLLVLSRGLDALLSDTAQDLGLVVELTERGGRDLGRLEEADLPAQAQSLGALLFWPMVSRAGKDVELRMVLAEPTSRALRVRVERVARGDLSVRAVIMLRDLVGDGGCPPGCTRGPARTTPRGVDGGDPALATPARSAGRATLVVNAAMFGGLAGYSVQRSSGSDDPRLLYPLLAVGAGIGLGGSIIVSEEWDVGIGDAWFLAASAWWPTLAGHLIYEGRFAEHSEDGDERWAFGLVSGVTGLTLGTVTLTLGGVAEGGAMVVHSGGGLGLIFGGLTELFHDGDIYQTPFAGMGYGAALGWLAATTLARIHVEPTRVLAIDLGAVLGGLGGAALASPLLFDEASTTQQRGWLGITAGSALVGGGIAWYLTRPSSGTAGAPTRTTATRPRAGLGRTGATLDRGAPMLGVLGESRAFGKNAPILGVGWRGPLP